jgi:hypothetical protein
MKILLYFSYYYCKRDIDDHYIPTFDVGDVEIIDSSDQPPLLGRIQPGLIFFFLFCYFVLLRNLRGGIF